MLCRRAGVCVCTNILACEADSKDSHEIVGLPDAAVDAGVLMAEMSAEVAADGVQ